MPDLTAITPRRMRLLGSVLISVCVTAVYYAASFLEPSGFSWVAVVFLSVMIYLIWESTAWVSDKLDARLPWSAGVGRRLAWQVGLGAVVALLAMNLPYTAIKLYSIRYYERPGSTYSLHIFMLVNGITLILYGIVQAAQLGWQFLSRWRQAELRAERLQRESTQARLAVLQTQVSPHFLFNNLNILSVLIDRSQPLAKEFVEHFAQVYRYVLSSQQRELVPLAEELEVVEAYVFLLRQRFAEGLAVELHIPAEARQQHLPPLALQMLIENAIKHNVVSASRPLLIQISADDAGWLTVTNNMQPRSSQPRSTGLGLANIRKRYEYLSEQLPEIMPDGDTFRVRLPLLQFEAV